MTKLVLVVDKDAAYAAFQRDRTLDKWGVAPQELQRVTSLDQLAPATLFGDTPTYLVQLEKLEDVKKAVATLKERGEGLQGNLESGVIMVTPVPRNSTKHLESWVEQAGGVVYTSPSKNREATIAEKLMGETHLSREASSYALDYVGEDYQSLLPLLRFLETLPRERQQRLTSEDVLLHFPQAKGAIAPWAIEGPLFNGNAAEAVSILNRVVGASDGGALITITIVRKKLQLAYRIAALRMDNPLLQEKQVAEILQAPANYPFKLAWKQASKSGFKRLFRAVQLWERAEANFKGASGAPALAELEIAVVRLANILKGER